MRKILLLVPLLLSACTWGITPDDDARNVRTAWSGDLSACRDMGKVTVSVMDHVGPFSRKDLTIRDELEIMARNEAAKMHGDTIRPLADPSAGSQPWGVYHCGGGLPPPPHRASTTSGATPAPGSTQTFPIHGR